MAPVDEAIARAKAERKKSMDQVVGSVVHGIGELKAQEPYRPSTLAEQAEKSSQYHQEEYLKLQQTSYFLTAHPEFEEFVRLVRAGTIQL